MTPEGFNFGLNSPQDTHTLQRCLKDEAEVAIGACIGCGGIERKLAVMQYGLDHHEQWAERRLSDEHLAREIARAVGREFADYPEAELQEDMRFVRQGTAKSLDEGHIRVDQELNNLGQLCANCPGPTIVEAYLSSDGSLSPVRCNNPNFQADGI